MWKTRRELPSQCKHEIVILGLYCRIPIRNFVVDIAARLPVRCEILHVMGGKTINVGLNKSGLTVKAIELIIGRSLSAGLIEISLCDDTRRYPLIRPLSALPKPVAIKRSSKAFFCFIKIEFSLICTNKCTLRIVSAFKHELLRKLVQVNIIY